MNNLLQFECKTNIIKRFFLNFALYTLARIVLTLHFERVASTFTFRRRCARLLVPDLREDFSW